MSFDFRRRGRIINEIKQFLYIIPTFRMKNISPYFSRDNIKHFRDSYLYGNKTPILWDPSFLNLLFVGRRIKKIMSSNGQAE
jgi:hypothetical protein